MKSQNKVKLIFAGAAMVAILNQYKNANLLSITGAKIIEETSISNEIDTNNIITSSYEESINNNEKSKVEYSNNNVESSSNYDDFIKKANNTTIEYIYSDLYGIDNAITLTSAEYVNNYDTLICDTSKIPTEDEIYRTIISNNNSLLSNNIYSKLTEEQLRLTAKIVHNSINSIYESLTDESKIRIYEELAHLSVLGVDSNNPKVSSSPFNATYKEDGRLLLDINMISKYTQSDALNRTITHEIEHIFQREYIDHSDGITRIGTSTYSNKLTVNPLIYSFINETTAESESMKETNHVNPLVYSKQFPYLRMLDLTALVNPNFEERAFEEANINCDQNKMYQMFNAKTMQEKQEVIKMLYSLDIVLSDRTDFNNQYTGTDTKEQKNINLLSQALFTNSRYFYTNLAERIQNGNATMEDCFYLINMQELNMNVALSLQYNPNMYPELVSKYTELQRDFFSFLAEKNNITEEEVENNYATYVSTESIKKLPSLNWLNDDEKQYLLDNYESYGRYNNCCTISSYNVNDKGLVNN